jgi:hypothetical protein
MPIFQVFNGAPEGIRTPDPQIRSLVLYPAELPALWMGDITQRPLCVKNGPSSMPLMMPDALHIV